MTEEEIKQAALLKAQQEQESAKAAADKLAAERAELEAEKAKLLAGKDKDLVTKLVEEKVAAELASIKAKLDASYKARDEAVNKAAALADEKAKAELKRLEEEGKHKEAFEMRLAAANAQLAALEKSNTELSRDVAVRDALVGCSFRNDTAADMATREITSQLIKNDKGQWVHRSGIAIKDFVDAFSKSEEQSFLFKPKSSSGSGTGTGAGSTGLGAGTGTPGDKKPSLFSLTQAQVLEMAAAGKLGVQPQF